MHCRFHTERGEAASGPMCEWEARKYEGERRGEELSP